MPLMQTDLNEIAVVADVAAKGWTKQAINLGPLGTLLSRGGKPAASAMSKLYPAAAAASSVRPISKQVARQAARSSRVDQLLLGARLRASRAAGASKAAPGAAAGASKAAPGAAAGAAAQAAEAMPQINTAVNAAAARRWALPSLPKSLWGKGLLAGGLALTPGLIMDLSAYAGKSLGLPGLGGRQWDPQWLRQTFNADPGNRGGLFDFVASPLQTGTAWYSKDTGDKYRTNVDQLRADFEAGALTNVNDPRYRILGPELNAKLSQIPESLRNDPVLWPKIYKAYTGLDLTAPAGPAAPTVYQPPARIDYRPRMPQQLL